MKVLYQNSELTKIRTKIDKKTNIGFIRVINKTNS